MRTTKTTVNHAYSVIECQKIMTENGLIAPSFPTMPVRIEFPDGRVMKVRETEAIGMDDEARPEERYFVIRIDGVPLAE